MPETLWQELKEKVKSLRRDKQEDDKQEFKLGCLFGPFCNSGDPAAPISAPRRSQRQDRTPQPSLTPISRIPRIPACDGR